VTVVGVEGGARVLSELRQARERVVGLDPATVSVSDCRDVAAELARLKNACAAAEAKFAARAGTSAEQLARAGGTSVGAAKAALETMSALGSCPETADALAAGDLSLAQAYEITRTERARPGSEGELLELAKFSDLRTLKERARKLRHEAIGIDEVHRRRVAARQFRWWTNDLGNVAFAGELPPETGVPLVNRIETECDRVRRDAKKNDGEPESRDAYRADALVRVFKQTGGVRGPNVDAVLVIDLPAWRRGYALPGERCHIIGGGTVPVAVANELAEDAFYKAVVYDGVKIDTVKHFGRYLKSELRTALDLGTAPNFEGITCSGCGNRFHLQRDHIDPVANGGLTSYDNLQLLCWQCHQEKTEQDRRAGLLDGRGRSP
jgi:hypothetical protein